MGKFYISSVDAPVNMRRARGHPSFLQLFCHSSAANMVSLCCFLAIFNYIWMHTVTTLVPLQTGEDRFHSLCRGLAAPLSLCASVSAHLSLTTHPYTCLQKALPGPGCAQGSAGASQSCFLGTWEALLAPSPLWFPSLDPSELVPPGSREHLPADVCQAHLASLCHSNLPAAAVAVEQRGKFGLCSALELPLRISNDSIF